MLSIKTTFGRAATGTPGVSTLSLLFFAIAILDDDDRRIDARRKKRDRAAKSQHAPRAKPPAGPRPF
jgi:hypothetical protein